MEIKEWGIVETGMFGSYNIGDWNQTSYSAECF